MGFLCSLCDQRFGMHNTDAVCEMFPGTSYTCCCCIQESLTQSSNISQMAKWTELKIIISTMYICHLLLGFVVMTTFGFFTDSVGVGTHATFDTGAISINQMFAIITEDTITTNTRWHAAQGLQFQHNFCNTFMGITKVLFSLFQSFSAPWTEDCFSRL